ncbi:MULTISPECIES: molecular chaperone Tir [unclassified Paraburkholderia]|uniref:molecular chaperone Tir n=1 Tax=unclassified Paraburkholderia TaxID=2615204 RepID=UPI002AB2BA8F|nr:MULTISPECIES: molecular chaperone Tir [unclassified Paraburkholderia]
MSLERYEALIYEVCEAVGLPDAEAVLDTRTLEIEGFDVGLEHHETDAGALYLNFQFGAVTAGRTLVVFRLMLEANLLIYAQDEAQLCLDADSGGIVLLVHLQMSDDVDGVYVAELLSHYADHGRYWRTSILESTDEMFEGIASGEYMWLRA